MKDLTVRQLQAYLLEHYQQSRTEEGLFIKLVEEVGEVAEVLNGRSGRKEGVQDSNEELAKELVDIIFSIVLTINLSSGKLKRRNKFVKKSFCNIIIILKPFLNILLPI